MEPLSFNEVLQRTYERWSRRRGDEMTVMLAAYTVAKTYTGKLAFLTTEMPIFFPRVVYKDGVYTSNWSAAVIRIGVTPKRPEQVDRCDILYVLPKNNGTIVYPGMTDEKGVVSLTPFLPLGKPLY